MQDIIDTIRDAFRGVRIRDALADLLGVVCLFGAGYGALILILAFGG